MCVKQIVVLPSAARHGQISPTPPTLPPHNSTPVRFAIPGGLCLPPLPGARRRPPHRLQRLLPAIGVCIYLSGSPPLVCSHAVCAYPCPWCVHALWFSIYVYPCHWCVHTLWFFLYLSIRAYDMDGVTPLPKQNRSPPLPPSSNYNPPPPPKQPHQVSSSHLARSYHHLFPVLPYQELPANASPELDACHGCQRRFDVASSKVEREGRKERLVDKLGGGGRCCLPVCVCWGGGMVCAAAARFRVESGLPICRLVCAAFPSPHP